MKLFESKEGIHFLVYENESKGISRSFLGYWLGDDMQGVFLAINILFFEFKIRY